MAFNPFDKPSEPAKPEAPKVVDEKQECLDKMVAILEEFGGESNVPPNHTYWDILKKYRILHNVNKVR